MYGRSCLGQDRVAAARTFGMPWEGRGTLFVCSIVCISGLPIIRALRSAYVARVVLCFVLLRWRRHVKKFVYQFHVVLPLLHVLRDIDA